MDTDFLEKATEQTEGEQGGHEKAKRRKNRLWKWRDSFAACKQVGLLQDSGAKPRPNRTKRMECGVMRDAWCGRDTFSGIPRVFCFERLKRIGCGNFGWGCGSIVQ